MVVVVVGGRVGGAAISNMARFCLLSVRWRTKDLRGMLDLIRGVLLLCARPIRLDYARFGSGAPCLLLFP